jgi:hypothetical protein
MKSSLNTKTFTLRDVIMMITESLWKFLEKRENRFRHINLN